LRASGRDTVAKAVRRVLEAARKQAHKAGVPKAYADYLREHMVPPTLAERRARALAYSQAREQLGDDAINIVIEDEITLYYQSFLDD
jgi:hypothetical protein